MRFAARAAALCAAVVLLTGAAHAPDMSALLGRMRAASGPVFRAHLVSTSTLTTDGESQTFSSDASGLRFWMRACSGSVCRGTYFDGMRLYSVNINGTALPQSTADRRFLRGLRTISSLTFLDPTFVDNGGSIRDDGTERIAGDVYRVLEVANIDAVPMRVYVDPATALIAFVRDVNGNAVFSYRDYRRVGPFMLPFDVTSNGVPLERYATRAVSDTPFAAPQGLKPTILRDTAPMFTDADSPSPVGDCTLGDVTVKCLIDTGNSGLSISLELAEQLHLPSLGAFEVTGLGHYATEVVRAGPLRVGNALFPAADYIVLNDIHRYGYDLVLGADVLANSCVEINGDAHTVVFGDRPSPGNSGTIPLAFENFVPVTNVLLGDVPAMLAVDTGDQSNINLAYAFYTQHSTLFKTTTQRSVSGVGANSVELLGTIPDVRIGDYTVTAQTIGTTRSLRGTAHGHVGAAFLKHFKVLLDYARGLMTLTPQRGDSAVRLTAPPR